MTSNSDLSSLVIQSGLDADVVKGLADRGQLWVAIRLANIPEGRERRSAEIRRRERIIRRQVALIRDGTTFSGRMALAICRDMEKHTLDTRISGQRALAICRDMRNHDRSSAK